jgi:hypothetical protein
MKTTFERFAGLYAVLAGLAGFLYAISFIFLKSNLLSALFLLLGGFFASAAILAVYQRVRETEQTFALWAVLFALAGAFGSIVHAGYDLSNAIHPPATLNPDLPSPVDPRGLAVFGFASVGLFVFSWLILRSHKFPSGLAWLGYLSAVLMLVLYLARLVILDATNPVVVIPALLEGFIVNPIWYIWLGVLLLRRQTAQAPETSRMERTTPQSSGS